MLRLRSDEQLVALLRAGHEEAFQAIYDRYRQRLLAYMRQMLRSRQDAEDALQDVFERAYWNLLSGSRQRELALRPWLYRIAHNRCIDQLRRPAPPPPEAMLQLGPPASDPTLEADRRETLRRLMIDVSRLPEQQRSALLMRELGGISYADVADALNVTVPAVKSLLVRARVSLVAAGEARDMACDEIRAELVIAHEGRVRPNATARRHLRDCEGCRDFRGGLRGVRRQLLALSPSAGPLGMLAKLAGGGSGGGSAAAAWGGSAASSAAGSGGLLGTTGTLATGITHVATLVAATVVTAGGAAALQHSLVAAPSHPGPTHRAPASVSAPAAAVPSAISAVAQQVVGRVPPSPPAAAATVAQTRQVTAAVASAPGRVPATAGHLVRHRATRNSDQMLEPIPDPSDPPATSSGQTPSAATTASAAPQDASQPAPNSSGQAGSTGSSTDGTNTGSDPGATVPPGTSASDPASPVPLTGPSSSSTPVASGGATSSSTSSPAGAASPGGSGS